MREFLSALLSNVLSLDCECTGVFTFIKLYIYNLCIFLMYATVQK